MSDIFGRVYKLDIGNGQDIITYDGFGRDTNDPNNVKYPAQIEFSVDQTPSALLSYAEITMYGVARERRQAIYEQYTSVRLIAGYENSFGTIFNGEIENVEIGRDKADTYVKLFCRSSANNWPNAYINQSFGKGTSQLAIIQAVAATFGVPVEIVGDFSTLPKAINGMTLIKDSKQVLNEMKRNFGFEWMIENDKMIIIKDGATRQDNDVFTFTSTNGMIGSPSITVKGIDVEVVLNPFIRPRDMFQVEAVTGRLVFNAIYYGTLSDISTGKGVHEVVSIVHDGNFYGDKWSTKIEGRRPVVV